jgi:hypothetical protein
MGRKERRQIVLLKLCQILTQRQDLKVLGMQAIIVKLHVNIDFLSLWITWDQNTTRIL